MPFLHVCPDGQAVPHIPQFELSLCVFVQTPLQFVPDVQTPVHTPLWQICPDVHIVPHIPQFELSDLISVQAPLQLVVPEEHN
jgi:hypothetical protein